MRIYIGNSFFFAAAVLAVAAVTPAIANDAPVGDDGRVGRAPAAEGAAIIKPSFGMKTVTTDKLRRAGVTLGDSEPAPEGSGLGSVAYGAIGPESTESIINWDSRTRAVTKRYPNRAVVYIERNGNAHCTGWMYAPNMVVTAGHCVHTGGSKGSWYSNRTLKVYPGKNNNKNPYGSCTPIRKWTVQGWAQNNDPKYDYGAMRLNCNIGNTVGWFGLFHLTNPEGEPAIITGYPGDKNRTQWTSADKIRDSITQMLGYRMDTIGGMSGSPIWHDRSNATANNGAWGFCVHNYGTGLNLFSNMNSCADLYGARIQNYINWRDQ
jgi:glutamyl endopeptidase